MKFLGIYLFLVVGLVIFLSECEAGRRGGGSRRGSSSSGGQFVYRVDFTIFFSIYVIRIELPFPVVVWSARRA